jgi:outer membrane protein
MTNIARVKARTQATKSAESALKATQAGYEVGTRNIIDVLLAQRTVFQAKRNFASARYDYILSMMRLKQVAGQLSPEDIFKLSHWLTTFRHYNQALNYPYTRLKCLISKT